jgi:hypothetical protein
MLGALGMAYALLASVSVNIWFPSIIGQTPGSIDPVFLWLIGGDNRGSFLSVISSTAILDLVDWSNFLVAH